MKDSTASQTALSSSFHVLCCRSSPGLKKPRALRWPFSTTSPPVARPVAVDVYSLDRLDGPVDGVAVGLSGHLCAPLHVPTKLQRRPNAAATLGAHDFVELPQAEADGRNFRARPARDCNYRTGSKRALRAARCSRCLACCDNVACLASGA